MLLHVHGTSFLSPWSPLVAEAGLYPRYQAAPTPGSRLHLWPSHLSASDHRTSDHSTATQSSASPSSAHNRPGLGFSPDHRKSFQVISHLGFTSPQCTSAQSSASLHRNARQHNPRLQSTAVHRNSVHSSASKHTSSPHDKSFLGFIPRHATTMQLSTDLDSRPSQPKTPHTKSRLHYITCQNSASDQTTPSPRTSPHSSASARFLEFHQLVFAPILRPLLPHAMLTAVLKDSLKDVPINHAVIHQLEGKFKHRLVHIVNRL